MRARAFAALCALLLLVVLGGCSSLPQHVERPLSTALPATTASTLGRIAADSSPDRSLTGFRLLPIGSFAIDTRLQLIRRAERSIDVQYYLIQDDETGRYLLRALRDAAQRGVRVRLLMDDLYTSGADLLLLGLDAHPNIELRLFNPFTVGRGAFTTRFLFALNEFSRVNRRMHNKLLIADGAMAVTGGRNIANEYFMRHEQANFVDLDTFLTGALVPLLQELFDSYWNSEVVYPARAVMRSDLPPELLRRQFEAMTGPEGTPPPEPPPVNDVLGYGPIGEDLDAGRLGLVWADAAAYADPPARDKGLGASYGLVPLEDIDSVRSNVVELMRRARSEVVLTSPYLIPGQRGLELMEAMRQRGVTVRVLTNSLAATDEPLAHSGYRRYRPAMLKLGVELHELSPLRMRRTSRLGMFDSTQGRLHAKTAVIDRRQVFIGSMNFDPRSEKHNTEMGIFINSQQLAREVLRLMDLDKLQASWRVVLDADGRLRWLAQDDEKEIVLTNEPEATFWTRFWLNLLAPLAPEELL
ncbi:phospholipase D family protein [Pseudaquabacterium terrae]|uniref:phospholipase D family protein n=1 Tax=Pseudaquabacterium terrae TaxID=2732868 RepID=UPI001FE4A8FC|nr:phospholipase D family protein [Aquabacterium terrae]